MPVKPDGKAWTVREQIVEDPASNLMLQFEVGPDGLPRLNLYGESLPFGNRTILFNSDGVEDGAGSQTVGLCRPGWLEQLPES